MNSLDRLIVTIRGYGQQVLEGLIVAAIVIIVVHLCGCAQPTPFRDGAEVAPPPGCVAGRARGVEC